MTLPPLGSCSRHSLTALTLCVSLLFVPVARAEQAQVDLAGTWKAGATAIEVSVESWGEDCGARPGSTHSNGGGIVTVEQKGQTLLLHGRDQDIRTDACWSRNPAMKRSAASYSDGMWMTRCRTTSDDPREELGIYTLTLQDPSTILYKDVSHYDWSLNESKCVATFTTTQTLTRTAAAKGDDEQLSTAPAVTAEPVAEAKGCRPGSAVNISLRPKNAEIEVGERVCFKARVSDATDCVLPSPNVSYQLSHAKGLRGTLSGGCFTAADNAADAEGEFRISARSGNAQTEAVVAVRRLDLSSLIARRMENSGLSGVEEADESAVDNSPKAVARIATHTAPVEAGGGRSVLLVLLGVLALGLTAAGFWMIRREPVAAKAAAADTGERAPRSQTAESKERSAPKPSSQSQGEVWICPACRIGYPAEQTTCPKDGARLVPYAEFAQRVKREREQQARGKRCPTCGRSYPATAAFCGDDGASLVDQS